MFHAQSSLLGYPPLPPPHGAPSLLFPSHRRHPLRSTLQWTAWPHCRTKSPHTNSARRQRPNRQNPTIPDVDQTGLASKHDDDDSEPAFAPPRRDPLSAPQLRAQLSRLSDRTRLRCLSKHPADQRSMATSGKDRGLVPHACLTEMVLPPGRVCKWCPDTPMCRKDWAIGAGQALAHAVCVDHSQTLNLSTAKPAARPKPPEGTMLAFTVLGGRRLADQ